MQFQLFCPTTAYLQRTFPLLFLLLLGMLPLSLPWSRSCCMIWRLTITAVHCSPRGFWGRPKLQCIRKNQARDRERANTQTNAQTNAGIMPSDNAPYHYRTCGRPHHNSCTCREVHVWNECMARTDLWDSCSLEKTVVRCRKFMYMHLWV